MIKNNVGKSKRRSLVVIKCRYTKDLKHAQNQVKYVAERSAELEREQREIFSKDNDRADWKTFSKSLDNKSTRHPSQVKSHHLIITMRRDDYERYGADYKEMVRQTMKNLERDKGMKLDWVAATHMKGKTPHVHVIVKSVGRTDQGRNKRLKIVRDDFRNMRRDMYTLLRENRAHQRMLDRTLLNEYKEIRRREMERQRELQPARTIGSAGKSIAYQLRRMMDEEERNRDYEQRNRGYDR